MISFLPSSTTTTTLGLDLGTFFFFRSSIFVQYTKGKLLQRLFSVMIRMDIIVFLLAQKELLTKNLNEKDGGRKEKSRGATCLSVLPYVYVCVYVCLFLGEGSGGFSAIDGR